MALGIDGVRIGTWTSPDGVTGCTVILPPEGTLGGIAVRGSAPGTREAAALGPTGHVEVCHAVVLSGSSAYGLAVADGVMGWLEEQGLGYQVGPGLVPIVGAAIVLDGGLFAPDQRPGPAEGRSACEQATADDPPEGSVGVGTGCTVAKVGGLDRAWRGGQGIAVRRAAGITVGAIVANNGLGEVVADDGTWLARARIPEGTPRYPEVGIARPDAPDRRGGADADHPSQPAGRSEPTGSAGPTGSARPTGSAGPTGRTGSSGTAGPTGPAGNTVIGAIVTDARLTKAQACRVADLGHSGIARALRPAHTQADGDALFCLATGGAEPDDTEPDDTEPDDTEGAGGAADASPGSTVDLVAHLAAEVVAEAARRGPLAAVGAHGVPGLADPA